jgi:hypothetical protein
MGGFNIALPEQRENADNALSSQGFFASGQFYTDSLPREPYV